MIIKLKAFIYRLSDVFGLSIYLAEKEENEYIEENGFKGKGLKENIARGGWQATHGFSKVLVWKKPVYVKVWIKLKHAFYF